MPRRQTSALGGVALPPHMNAAAVQHVRFEDAVAECFRRRLKGDVEASTKAIAKAAQSPRAALTWHFRVRSWASKLSYVVSPLALTVLIGHSVGELDLSLDAFRIFGILSVLVLLVPIVWHSWQYAWGFPEAPLPVAHETDSIVEAIFATLQAPHGPRLMVRIAGTGLYLPLDQRVCFGRLRYLLLSRFSEQRSDVTAFPYPWYLYGDLYLTPTDTDRLIEGSKQTRKGGPGRKPKHRYDSASQDVSRKYARKRLPPDPDEARALLENELIGWFKNLNDSSATIPTRAQVRRHAAEIHQRLASKG